MSMISYLRVSTAGQTVENQRQAIATAGYGIDREFADAATSGTTAAESRSTVDVLSTINALDTRGVRLVILQQQFDTGTAAGKLALTMFAAFAEFENSIRKALQREGIARARMEGGKYQGRKPKLTAEQRAELKQRFEAGENRSQLARDFGIDRVTVHRYCSATDG